MKYSFIPIFMLKGFSYGRAKRAYIIVTHVHLATLGERSVMIDRPIGSTKYLAIMESFFLTVFLRRLLNIYIKYIMNSTRITKDQQKSLNFAIKAFEKSIVKLQEDIYEINNQPFKKSKSSKGKRKKSVKKRSKRQKRITMNKRIKHSPITSL